MLSEPQGFREFVLARSPALLRTAWMLTGDAALAEDLLQTALARTWPHWGKVQHGSPDAYVRTAMVRTHVSWRRRRWHGETPTEELAAHAGRGADEHSRTEERIVLQAALASLPLRQRQAVVLRYFDDLSVEEVAAIMRSSTGTVKSQCAKGLTKLRAALNVVMEVDKQ